ncbi:4Fe-4S dicluster domain-containing protein [Cryptosporangium aurantiacum]|uniref:4Fe-4S dicluster domain-containing protein n=1 Tax=Cryptosporangium aurantiacum TaxID=134849 RepID=A0A1M7PEJ4_9ACTN|nr:4Fe-4S dicluster domain-containing protein [Cryptosporangium aurantiacum]SHN15386.1 4Fe-4S dicluster domain-containing protein [Cryptosporangium aurantiacum]
MAKTVRMLAEVLLDKCTGCGLCLNVCPTVALTLRGRTPDDPVGPGTRKVAELAEPDCYNAQNCVEICPEDALAMHPLPEPFRVTTPIDDDARDAIGALCREAGVHPKQPICFCAETRAAEIAAAILRGADSPEDVSLATGARTGCTELCQQPILRLLAAAGHGDAPKNPPRGFQWYGIAAGSADLVDDTGHVAPEYARAYPMYPLDRDVQALRGNFEEA